MILLLLAALSNPNPRLFNPAVRAQEREAREKYGAQLEAKHRRKKAKSAYQAGLEDFLRRTQAGKAGGK